MRLESVKLRNIRSYENEHVEFPEGSVLLSGEVGSGKSSLLLAVEFALFGIKRGELSGDLLLRRGKKTGSVELTFSLNGRKIVVGRSLRRVSGSIRQDDGYLKIDGAKTEYTPTELKAHILGLLGYPQELLHKQKSLIYRFTVYTPQEQLKEIIRADDEERLDTLRKVFGVDRYKQIRENIDELLSTLRSKRRELSRIYQDLDEKRNKQKRDSEELEKIEKELKGLKEEEKKINKKIRELNDQKKKIDEKIDRYNQYDKQLGQEKTRREGIEKELKDLKREIEDKSEKVSEAEKLQPPTELSKEELESKIEDLNAKIQKYLTDPSGLNDELDRLNNKKTDSEEKLEKRKEGLTVTKTNTENLNESIEKLQGAEKICPVCGKELDEKHKEETLDDFYRELKENLTEKDRLKDKINELSKKIERLDQQIEEKIDQEVEKLRQKIKEIENTEDELKTYNEAIEEAEKIEEKINELESDKEGLEGKLEELNDNIADLEDKLDDLKDVKSEKEDIEGKLDDQREKYADIRGKVAGKEADIKNLKGNLEELEKEIEQKKDTKKFNIKLGNIENWFEDYLINLTRTIEQHFMLELRRKFDPLFRDWFNLLIENELYNVRIDDKFAPIIEDKGEPAPYETLSGGESASVALAYRLALNKVINTLIEDINSRDLIILDEPTDGFSHNQLDNIRDVINQLGTRQIIIVSHDPKIESYVDNIIRVRKEGGVSKIDS